MSRERWVLYRGMGYVYPKDKVLSSPSRAQPGQRRYCYVRLTDGGHPRVAGARWVVVPTRPAEAQR